MKVEISKNVLMGKYNNDEGLLLHYQVLSPQQTLEQTLHALYLQTDTLLAIKLTQEVGMLSLPMRNKLHQILGDGFQKLHTKESNQKRPSSKKFLNFRVRT